MPVPLCLVCGCFLSRAAGWYWPQRLSGPQRRIQDSANKKMRAIQPILFKTCWGHLLKKIFTMYQKFRFNSVPFLSENPTQSLKYNIYCHALDGNYPVDSLQSRLPKVWRGISWARWGEEGFLGQDGVEVPCLYKLWESNVNRFFVVFFFLNDFSEPFIC